MDDHDHTNSDLARTSESHFPDTCRFQFDFLNTRFMRTELICTLCATFNLSAPEFGI